MQPEGYFRAPLKEPFSRLCSKFYIYSCIVPSREHSATIIFTKSLVIAEMKAYEMLSGDGARKGEILPTVVLSHCLAFSDIGGQSPCNVHVTIPISWFCALCVLRESKLSVLLLAICAVNLLLARKVAPLRRRTCGLLFCRHTCHRVIYAQCFAMLKPSNGPFKGNIDKTDFQGSCIFILMKVCSAHDCDSVDILCTLCQRALCVHGVGCHATTFIS